MEALPFPMSNNGGQLLSLIHFWGIASLPRTVQMELAADCTLLQIHPYLVHRMAPKQAQILDRVPILFCYLERRAQVRCAPAVSHVSRQKPVGERPSPLPSCFREQTAPTIPTKAIC